MVVGFVLWKPKSSMWCGSLCLRAILAFACYLILVYVPLGSSARTPTVSTLNNLSLSGGIIGLQHRDFDEELTPNLSFQERLESSLRRSHARKARIEGMLSRSRDTRQSDSTKLGASKGNKAKTGEVYRGGKELGSFYNGKELSRDSRDAKTEGKLGVLEAETGEREVNEAGEGSNSSRGGKAYSATIEAVDGAFLTSIYVGTPPKRVRAILDTGSDLVWQQCMPCLSCFMQPDLPIFDPTLSSSFKRASCAHKLCQQLLRTSSSPSSSCSLHSSNMSCQFVYTYGDNSYTSGELAFDTLTLPDPNGQDSAQVKEFAFGCGYINHGASFTGSDGVLGMGQGPLSLASQLSFPSFSYCLTSLGTSQPSPLLLGDHATDFLPTKEGSQVQETSILTNNYLKTFYYLNLTGISLNGDRLNISTSTFALKTNGSGGMIVDSGTTITYLQEHGYRVVLKAIRSKLTNQDLRVSRPMFGLDLCFPSLNESALPSLTFHFNGADMDVPSSSLFVDVAEVYCLALGGSREFSILGNVQQQNYQMVFDRSKQKISFMQTSCDQVLT